MDKIYYLVEEKDLKRLIEGYFVNIALECSGVDNWPYWSDAIHEHIKYYNEDRGVQCEDIDDIVRNELLDFNVIATSICKMCPYNQIPIERTE